MKFSTDGTRLGVIIAHTMGTDSEKEIAASSAIYDSFNPFESDVDAEQDEWEEGQDD